MKSFWSVGVGSNRLWLKVLSTLGLIFCSIALLVSVAGAVLFAYFIDPNAPSKVPKNSGIAFAFWSLSGNWLQVSSYDPPFGLDVTTMSIISLSFAAVWYACRVYLYTLPLRAEKSLTVAPALWRRWSHFLKVGILLRVIISVAAIAILEVESLKAFSMARTAKRTFESVSSIVTVLFYDCVLLLLTKNRFKEKTTEATDACGYNRVSVSRV